MIDTLFTDILLIERDSAEAELTTNAILQSRLTDKIHWVKDAEEGVHFIFGLGKYTERNPAKLPRLVILDSSISQQSGVEFLKIIKEIPSTKRIAVFILTTIQENEYFADAVSAGVNMCMVKPNDAAEFAQKLKHELGYYWRLFEKD